VQKGAKSIKERINWKWKIVTEASACSLSKNGNEHHIMRGPISCCESHLGESVRCCGLSGEKVAHSAAGNSTASGTEREREAALYNNTSTTPKTLSIAQRMRCLRSAGATATSIAECFRPSSEQQVIFPRLPRSTRAPLHTAGGVFLLNLSIRLCVKNLWHAGESFFPAMGLSAERRGWEFDKKKRQSRRKRLSRRSEKIFPLSISLICVST